MSEQHWISARYAHQGQEKPNQPDDSWDPYAAPINEGGTPWWNFDPFPVIPDGFIDWGTPGPSCYMNGYSQPGDRYQMPVPAFYPGECLNLEAYSGTLHNAVQLPDDGGFFPIAAGESVVLGAMTYHGNYRRLSPPPVLSDPRGHFYFRIRGHGTVTGSVFLDVGSQYPWYDSGDVHSALNWEPETRTLDIDSDDWIDIGIPIPGRLITSTSLINDALVVGLKASSGSVEIDYAELRIAGDCGYHRKAFTVEDGQWGKVRQWVTGWSDWYPRVDTELNQTRYITDRHIRLQIVYPDEYRNLGGDLVMSPELLSEIVERIRGDLDQLQSGGQPLLTGSTATTAPPTDGSAYVVSSTSQTPSPDTPKWVFRPYYAGVPPIPPRDADWSWGTGTPALGSPEVQRRIYLQGIYRRVTNWKVIPSPAAAELTGNPDIIVGIHHVSAGAGEYDESEFPDIRHVLASELINLGPVPSNPDYQQDTTIRTEVSTTWRSGDPFPAIGSNQLVSRVSNLSGGGRVEDFPMAGESLPGDHFALFHYIESGTDGGPPGLTHKVFVNLPRYHHQMHVWEYLGG